MGQVETLMVVVLIVLAGLLGLLLGGSGAWFLKPSGESKVIDKVLNKYVCADGTVKNTQAECPKVKSDGKIECPPCTGSSSGNPNDFIYTRCDCSKCATDCGTGAAGGVTTTTIWQPTCKSCNSDLDCGETKEEYACTSWKERKLIYTPKCDDGCCLFTQQIIPIRSCTDNERCDNGRCTLVTDTGD
ncbi:MAG: hypothetical protein KKD39_05705 [Candidatus Altiarchaeota archaeon]|nr:hypothetical protein [Candidatus Altiarchaeota archaeon]